MTSWLRPLTVPGLLLGSLLASGATADGMPGVHAHPTATAQSSAPRSHAEPRPAAILPAPVPMAPLDGCPRVSDMHVVPLPPARAVATPALLSPSPPGPRVCLVSGASG